jgi:hypothetical protein
MITKNEVNDMIVEVKQNIKLLSNCKKPHNFSINITPERTFNKRFKCSKCNGITDNINKVWYEKGLKDANIKDN